MRRVLPGVTGASRFATLSSLKKDEVGCKMYNPTTICGMVGHSWAYPVDKNSFSQWLRTVAVERNYSSHRKFLSDHCLENQHGWMSGIGSPAPSGVSKLSKALEISESEILSRMGLGQFTTASEWSSARKKQTITKERAKRVARYRTDCCYRGKVLGAIKSKRPPKSSRRLQCEYAMSLTGEAKAMYVQSKQTETSQRRRARMAAKPGTFTRHEFWNLCKSFGYLCAYCGGRQTKLAKNSLLTAEHVLPLTSDHPSATNQIENILPVCRSCNSSKCDRNLIEWATALGKPISDEAIARYDYLIGSEHAKT